MGYSRSGSACYNIRWNFTCLDEGLESLSNQLSMLGVAQKETVIVIHRHLVSRCPLEGVIGIDFYGPYLQRYFSQVQGLKGIH